MDQRDLLALLTATLLAGRVSPTNEDLSIAIDTAWEIILRTAQSHYDKIQELIKNGTSQQKKDFLQRSMK